MDNSLTALQGLLLAMALSILGGLVSLLPFDAGVDSLAAYVRMIGEKQRLEEDRIVLGRSAEAMQTIVDELIAGQLSLSEATTALCAEDESRPQHLRTPLLRYLRHCPKEERYRHQLLHRVENELDGDPRQGEVLKRLRQELESGSPVPRD